MCPTLAQRVAILENKVEVAENIIIKIVKFLKKNKRGIEVISELVNMYENWDSDTKKKTDWEHLLCMAVNNHEDSDDI